MIGEVTCVFKDFIWTKLSRCQLATGIRSVIVFFMWLCSHVIFVTFVLANFQRAISRSILYQMLNNFSREVLYM